MDRLPTSAPLAHISPSDYEWLVSCPRHLAFEKEPHPAIRQSHRSVPQRLGDVAHRALERLVRDGLLSEDGWAASFDSVWAEEVRVEAASAAAEGLPGGAAPEGWADYQIKRIGTRRLADRIRDLLQSTPAREARAEEKIIAFNGRMVGKIDLLIRSAALHAVIDYKTGEIGGTDGQPLKAQYVRQLSLYAALEHEATGSWPSKAAVFPLREQPVWLDIDPSEASAMAADALQRLDSYNDVTPGPQAARVAAENCGRCAFSVVCGDFWDALPGGDILAIDGHVSNVFFAEQGTVTLLVESDSLRLEAQAVNPAYHPAVRRIAPGDRVRIVGATIIGELSEPPAISRCRLPAWGNLRVDYGRDRDRLG